MARRFFAGGSFVWMVGGLVADTMFWMKRLGQWFFNFAAIASLVLCLSTVILWIVCHGKQGSKPARIPLTGGRFAVVFWDGAMAVAKVPDDRPRTGPLYLRAVYLGPGRVPTPALATLFLMAPALWMFTRRRPIPAGHCQFCGYNLVATPERCPECGMAPADKESISS
jgi:hypothetical protein